MDTSHKGLTVWFTGLSSAGKTTISQALLEQLRTQGRQVEWLDGDIVRQACRNDHRITRIGRWLRRWNIDELPQLINVLRGDMSLVGPRPHAVAAHAGGVPYGKAVDDYPLRHRVKPGITGWAQLCYPYGSSERDALEKLQYDLYYIKNNSLLFDLSVLMQTVEVVVMGKGAR